MNSRSHTYRFRCVLLAVGSVLWTATPVQAGHVRGTVVDLLSQAPVVGASVTVDGTGLGAVTDSAGVFRLSTVAEGSYKLSVSHIAYHSVVVDVIVPTVADTDLHIELQPASIPLAGIEVHALPVGAAEIHRSPSFATVVTRETFDGQATTVPEVLSASTGVQVKRLGGLGGFSTVSVRGSSAEQVEVYLDGVPLNSSLGGGVNLENLPLSQVSQIEVYRGAGTKGAGVGGTVHIRTMQASAGPTVGGAVSLGSFDTRSASFLMSSGQDWGEALVLGEYQSSDNDFRYLDDNGTEYNLNDDVRVSRRNSDFRSVSLLGKWSGSNDSPARFYLQQNLFWKWQGLPGLGSNQADRARFDTFRGLSEAGVSVGGLLEHLTVRTSLFLAHKRESLSDPLGEIGIGREENEYVTRSYGWTGLAEAASEGGSSIAVRTSIQQESFNPRSLLQPDARQLKSGRWSFAAGMGGDLAFLEDRGILSVSADVSHLRSQVYDENPYRFSPLAPDTLLSNSLANVRAGLRFTVRPWLVIKANVGRGNRAPSFFELFGDRGGVLGNTGLTPETGITWDAGFRSSAWEGAALFEAVYFDHRYRDLIQFVQFSQGVGRAQNIGQARSRGLELTSGLSPLKGFRISGNYTYQKAVDRSDVPHRRGKILPNRPQHEVNGHGSFVVGPVSLFYDYTFEDGNFLDRANLRPVPARHIHNAGVTMALPGRIEMTLEAKNVMDNQVADTWGYPLPGRSYFVTLKHSRRMPRDPVAHPTGGNNGGE